MQNNVKLLAITAIIAAIGLSMMGCEEPDNTDNTPEPNSNNDITYTLARADGEDGVSNTTGIVFTFSASVDSLNLTAADITVGGTASKGETALSGTGTTRTLAITVNSAGTATVTINKTGIEAGTKNLIVFKAGESAPTLTGITAVYTQGSTIIYPTTPLNSLKANLTVKAQYTGGGENTLSDNEYALSGTLTVGTSTVTVTYTDSESVTKTTTFDVTVTAASSNKTLTGITLNTASVKRDYLQNEALNLSGLVVTANYSDSPSAAVTTYTTSPTNGAILSTIGTQTVTVSYTEGAITRNNTFTVTVIDPAAGTPGLEFVLINNGTAYSVRKGSVSSGVVYIPATHNSLPVTEIGSASDDSSNSGAFNNTAITGIIIPESVTTIGSWAFFGCTDLTSITIPASVTYIGGYVFYHGYDNTSPLASITFVEGSQLETIGDYAFYGTSLTGITIPEGVTSIGNYAFFGCTSLTDIIIDTDKVTSYNGNTFSYGHNWGTIFSADNLSVTFKKNVGDYAFYNCDRLTSVTLGEGVTSIGDNAFSGCTGLTSITVNAGNPNYASEGGILYNKVKTTLIRAPEGITGTVTIPVNVTSIGSNAFFGCTGITNITLPDSVTSIGSSAFYGWTNAQTIYVNGYGSQAAADAAWGYSWRNGCNAVIEYYRIVSEITITQQPNKTVYVIGDQLDIAGLVVTAAYNDGTTGTVTVTAADITGFNTVAAGEQTLTVTYRGKTAMFTVTVRDNNFTVTNTNEWNAAISAISTGGNNHNYYITVSGDVGVAGSASYTFSSVGGLTVTLKGNGKLYLTSQGHMICLTYNQTLIIDSADLTLQGLKNGQNGATQNNNAPVVVLDISNSKLELRNGTITGNTIQNNSSDSSGGGVNLRQGGTFIMTGGEISGNTANSSNGYAAYGGGVYVGGNSSFTMSGGTISNNTAFSAAAFGGSNNNGLNARGGGVYVGGTFNMTGGTITGNTASTPSDYQFYLYAAGGGVYVGGTFNMTGGTISGNNTITNPSSNKSSYAVGGGVAVYGTFIMNGGEIKGNTATASGSSSNSQPIAQGGGVWVINNGIFRMVTGTIYGSGEGTSSNTVTGTGTGAIYNGAALYSVEAGIAQRGTFSGETWNSSGNLITSGNYIDTTIRVENGALQ